MCGIKGNGEVIRPSQSGLLAAPGDLEETAAHIVRLLRDPALRARLGASDWHPHHAAQSHDQRTVLSA